MLFYYSTLAIISIANPVKIQNNEKALIADDLTFEQYIEQYIVFRIR